MAVNLAAFFDVSRVTLTAEDRPSVGVMLEAVARGSESARALT